ncbi:unnamed protein product [Microthlaspi erraticum]|uniref:FBD domain-containing protein n=1 Tax=Microthlaspi erraticum TaxID=1685480 RepID=A0A6D2L337_9BRAS|nr:unnamed protein product [Microthlaspi erraticum]
MSLRPTDMIKSLELSGQDLSRPSSLAEEDEDKISLLPESLICHILSFLTTDEAVFTSVLSSTWRYLWKRVPKLELESSDFPNDEACVDFIDKFLNVQSLLEFSLCIDSDGSKNDASLYEFCLGKWIKRKIHYFEVLCHRNTKIPIKLPPCEALGCLSLNDTSSCVLDTPRLEYLSLIDNNFKSLNIISMSDSVEVFIDVDFKLMHHDLSERNIIHNLLSNFSAIGDMTISWTTLKLIHGLRHTNPLPKFRYLTCLHATMSLDASPELLPIVLESCPNLKRLTLVVTCFKHFGNIMRWIRLRRLENFVMDDDPEGVATILSNVLPYCLVCSLEYVTIRSPITDKATTRKLVRYFLGNATSLKNLVLRLSVFYGEKPHNFDRVKQYFDSPRRSHLCHFEVIWD